MDLIIVNTDLKKKMSAVSWNVKEGETWEVYQDLACELKKK